MTLVDDGSAAPATLAEGTVLLEALGAAADAREAAVRDLVLALGEVVRAGVTERLEGLPVDVVLRVRQRWTDAEVAMLCDAADALTAMPATRQWWAQGVLSWSMVRDVVAAVRPLGRDGRAAVDARLAASGDRLHDMSPSQIAWAVADAVDEVRGPAEVRQRERAAREGSFLALQLGLDGHGRLYGELDQVDTAIVAAGLDHRAAQEQASTEQTPEGSRDPMGHDGAATPTSRRARRRTRARLRAGALVGLCRDALGGPGHEQTPRRAARPLIVVHVPLDRITATAGGLLEVAVPSGLPRLSAALVESLAADADVRAVVMDGARPLCVTTKVDAATVPEDVRLAVQARDLGARDMGGATTVPLSHLHHLDPGSHHVDRMVVASPRGHLRVIHRHGWRGQVDPSTGTVTWTSLGRRPITTRPWGTPLARGPRDGPEPPSRRPDAPEPPPPDPPPPG